MKLFLLSFIFLLPLFTLADTTWLNKKWRPCEKDTAAYFSTLKKTDSLWLQQIFFIKENRLFMKGYYADENEKIKSGPFNWFNFYGVKTDSSFYKKGIPVYICHYHENGLPKRVIINDEKYQTTDVFSWDATGNPINADTFYNNHFGRDCNKDTAVTKLTVIVEEGLWHYRIYNMKGVLLSDWFFKDKKATTRAKFERHYYNGILLDSLSFHVNGKLSSLNYYYKTGNLCASLTFDSSGKRTSVRNWNEQGQSIKADSSLRYAMPIEGFRSWQKKLLKKINSDKSIDKKTRQNLYGSVFIGFFIDEDGMLSQSFISESSPYKQMDSLILNYCGTFEKWKPCIFFGRPSPFYGVHSFSFVKGKVIKYKTLY